MPLRRQRHRRWIALIALLGLLFQQLAMATYVCPVDGRTAATVSASSDEQPPCHQAQATDKARCHAHCHPMTPSADHAATPTVPAAILPPTTWLRAAAWQPRMCADLAVAHEVAARAAAPPLTVRHCTFQI